MFPPHADPRGDCVLATLVEEDPSRSTHDWPQGFEGGLAHRLDVPTSGALLCADDPEELAEIRAAFASGAFTKVYRFVAGREVSWDHHVCDRPNGKVRHP